MSKEAILKSLREFAAVEGGNISLRRFVALSGFKEKQIIGTHWPTWNGAKQEAGLGTAAFIRPRLNDGQVIPAFVRLLASLGRWPTEAELRFAKRRDADVPSVKVVKRLEGDPSFMSKLTEYCTATSEFAELVPVVTARIRRSRGPDVAAATTGYVYMMRSGRRYKIGHTSSPARRHREVRLDLPERTDVVHSIATDDPAGIEAYWHSRFAKQRIRDTEFFVLTASDVAAFKKRKFQ